LDDGAPVDFIAVADQLAREWWLYAVICVVIDALLALALALQDQLDQRVTLDTFAGHPLVVSFVSARCSEVCPLIDAEVARAADRERARHGPLRFLTITLDPQHDTHADIVRLARTFHADHRYWRIASGSVGAVRAYMQRFGVQAVRDSRGDITAHTSAVVVLNAAGNVAAELLPSSHLADDIGRVEAQR
jgi:protein SCO1